MSGKKWQIEAARQFDGEQGAKAPKYGDREAVEKYLAELQSLRDGARALKGKETISEGQFPAFLNGIHEEIERPRRVTGGYWAVLSVTTAALLVAFSALIIFSGKSPDVTATVLDEVTTEVEGARVYWEPADNGDVAVWIDVAERDE